MDRNRRTTAHRFLPLGVTALVGALMLAGCASSDDETTATSSGSASAGATPGSSGSAGNDALAAAGRTALDAVGSGTVIAIEQEAGGTSWEVLVATDDGSEHEVHTDAAGTSVTAGPTRESADADDLAENQRYLAAAERSYSDAASVMTDTVAGTVTELGLDDHAGAVVWEGDVVDASNTTHRVRIDAGTGDVVTNDVDTDSDD